MIITYMALSDAADKSLEKRSNALWRGIIADLILLAVAYWLLK
jgi:hypothetical protein